MGPRFQRFPVFRFFKCFLLTTTFLTIVRNSLSFKKKNPKMHINSPDLSPSYYLISLLFHDLSKGSKLIIGDGDAISSLYAFPSIDYDVSGFILVQAKQRVEKGVGCHANSSMSVLYCKPHY